jgi:hypothetical protein
MNPLRCIVLLQFATTLALGQTAHQSAPINQPAELVRSLYTQVIAHHPSGLLTDAEMKTITPYLSKSLLHKIDDARACSADWETHNPDPHLKAEMASEYGLFSGKYEYGLTLPDERGPAKFKIDIGQAAKDGPFRVYVSLTAPSAYEQSWRVAPIVVTENGRLAVNDVIFLDDNTYPDESDRRDRLLSEYLTAGCNGPHWIGPSLPHEPQAFVRSLYSQVIARAPGGIPEGADWKIFAPYMSRALQHRIALAVACETDWFRQHKDLLIKAPFGTSEMGLFSGSNEETSPRTFHIERTGPQKDGSIRVYVTLGLPQYKMTWPVAVALHREDARLVIDDVIFLKDEHTNQDKDYRLSQALSYGCHGGRWVAPD